MKSTWIIFAFATTVVACQETGAGLEGQPSATARGSGETTTTEARGGQRTGTEEGATAQAVPVDESPAREAEPGAEATFEPRAELQGEAVVDPSVDPRAAAEASAAVDPSAAEVSPGVSGEAQPYPRAPRGASQQAVAPHRTAPQPGVPTDPVFGPRSAGDDPSGFFDPRGRGFFDPEQQATANPAATERGGTTGPVFTPPLTAPQTSRAPIATGGTTGVMFGPPAGAQGATGAPSPATGGTSGAMFGPAQPAEGRDDRG